MHTLFLTRGRLESTWQVLRMFGYDHDLRIAPAVLDRLPAPPSSDGGGGGGGAAGAAGALELSRTALSYLSHAFDIYDSGRGGLLSPVDLEHMLNRAPVPVYQV